MTIKDTLPEDVLNLIIEHNANSKLNSFLSNNKDCNDIIKKISNGDRWQFVNRMSKIEKELIIFANSFDERIVLINEITKGTVKHKKTKEFEGKTLDNSVSFRREHEMESYPETIALWVDTGDKRNSHLYPINRLTVVEESLNDECNYVNDQSDEEYYNDQFGNGTREDIEAFFYNDECGNR